jgi:hypothetical protein
MILAILQIKISEKKMVIIFYHIFINKRVNIHIYQKSHLYS